jgi:hypothetical protein
MKQTKAKTATTGPKKRVDAGNLFEKDNLKWMLIGAVVMAIGFILMAGGRSEDPNVFNVKEVYGFRRITIAPVIILAGLVIEIYAIFRTPKTS